MRVDVGQALAQLAPILGWKHSLPCVGRYFRTGVRAVRPTDPTTTLIDDATRPHKTTPAQHAAAATAWAELRRRCWGMKALCARSTLPLHRHLGNPPEYDRILSIVLAARSDGAVAAELTYEQGASEIGKSRSTWWRRYKRAEEEGWLGVTKHVEGHKSKRNNKTNLYYPGPLLLERLRDPEVGKAIAREAEVAAYKAQRGTDPKPTVKQELLLVDLEPASGDCPVGAWVDEQPAAAANEPPNEADRELRRLQELIEAASEPPGAGCTELVEQATPPDELAPAAEPEAGPFAFHRLATRAGWEQTEDGTWLLRVESTRDDDLDVVMTETELKNFFARRHPSRIATTTAELIKFSGETDQTARVRRDMAEKTARRGRGLPAPPRLELDEGAAAVLETMWRRAADLNLSPDPDWRRQGLELGAIVDAGPGGAPPQTAALATLVAQATARGSPNGARVAAFAELARAIAAMPAPPAGLIRLEGSLRHVLKDYPERGTDDEDSAS